MTHYHIFACALNWRSTGQSEGQITCRNRYRSTICWLCLVVLQSHTGYASHTDSVTDDKAFFDVSAWTLMLRAPISRSRARAGVPGSSRGARNPRDPPMGEDEGPADRRAVVDAIRSGWKAYLPMFAGLAGCRFEWGMGGRRGSICKPESMGCVKFPSCLIHQPLIRSNDSIEWT